MPPTVIERSRARPALLTAVERSLRPQQQRALKCPTGTSFQTVRGPSLLRIKAWTLPACPGARHIQDLPTIQEVLCVAPWSSRTYCDLKMWMFCLATVVCESKTWLSHGYRSNLCRQELESTNHKTLQYMILFKTSLPSQQGHISDAGTRVLTEVKM